MIRFSKRSRISFSTPPGGVPIATATRGMRPRESAPASSRPRLWTETADPLDVDLADLCDRDLREDRVLDVDRDGIEVLALEPEPEPHAAATRLRLPTPRPPPRHSSSPSSASIAVRRSMPPTSFVPAAASIAPVAMDTVTLVAAGRPRSLSGRPSLRWATALLVIGAGFGFVASFLSQPFATPSEQPAAVVVTSAEQAMAPTTLSFETPLDIRIPARAPAPAPAPATVEPQKALEKAPKLATAQKAPPSSPVDKGEKPEKTEKVAPKLAVAPPPPPPAPVTARPIAKPAIELTSRVAAKPVDVNRRNLANASPEAVDALVREQLSSALR